MSFPPFPSQDLAKLVLGYLAEEQLMTAYDEFLQASPYLDALKNEYDRIFMTSLKSILAEYRAVKICVDTCKPFALRKKIFQCTNLLEVVKFLIANVDIKKLQLQETTDKRLEKPSVTITPKPSTCELCHSLSLPNCVCKTRTDVQKPLYTGYIEASSLQNSVEATPLADLPGNHGTTRKKHVKILDKDSLPLHSNVSSLQSTVISAKQSFSSNISPEEYLAQCENSPVAKNDSTLTLSSTVKSVDTSKSNHNIEEFNNVLKSVVRKNKTLSSSEIFSQQRISNAGTFQDFASGVSSGENHSATYNVPDSSTSENSNVRAPLRKDVYNDNIKGPPQCQLMLQVSHVNDAIEIQSLKSSQLPKLPKLLPKTFENQIKIISDVKVDSKLNDKFGNKKNMSVPINATSTPMMQMQTIMINGTPAYKHTSNTHAFTKDEIMAMPTLIVVPASGSSQVPTSAHCDPIMTSNNVMSEANTSPRVLGPLVIDVPENTNVSNKPVMEALPDLSEQKLVQSDLVKPVDLKNGNIATASVPKDNVIPSETNTPQVLPPKRKSSSTPRRSSHIRVLDFTTPRRILHETINEQVPTQSSNPPVEVVESSSQGTVSATTTETDIMNIKNKSVVNEEGKNNDSGSTKENETANKTKKAKKYDWDADLRALVANEKPVDIPHRKPKPKSSKKKKSSDKTPATKEAETKKKTRSKQSPRVKKSTSQIVIELDDEAPSNTDKKGDVPCKPNIKIISGDKVTDLQERKSDSSDKNKSHDKSDECVDTPETERLSLQNVIGAKLNISDFLETPYKQVLYDIQMETPRCLGPDIPGEPISDIKITNIPTPRFLNSPMIAPPTPAYSSRPTDYSSGGSYYKPDDQDYMPIPDLTTCPVTSSKEDVSCDKSVQKDNGEKKARPVRKCAKNVSYYKNFGAVKNDIKDTDAISSCSETSANSSLEFKGKKETSNVKTPRTKSQSTSKSDSKKKISTSKKLKSSKDSIVKDKTKLFMKIKPKYTAKRGTPAKNGKKMVQSPHSKGFLSIPQRKRTTSKDRLVNSASAIVPAATKSRRKSSTPRKLHCTKTFNAEVCGHDSPDVSNVTPNVNPEKTVNSTHDSDTEQIALHWSDEGSSEDGKQKYVPTKTISKDTENITEIQEFIVSSDTKCDRIKDGTLQRDLMKRGFDLETAKIIERDLLDETPMHTGATKSRTLPIPVDIVENKKDDSNIDKIVESSASATYELQDVQDESDDEVELSVHECNEESNNYFVFTHDYTKEVSQQPPIKIKDNFTMEICIDDVTMRLKAPPFKLILDQDPITVDEIDYSYKETKEAVASISGMDKLYTPLKDSFKSQCYEIFDSTLTSIDTPLKATSPKRNPCDASITELVLEKEKDKTEAKDNVKRKRARSSSNDSTNSSKRTKSDADLLLKAADIQNIDIETVLTKLHGH